MKKGTKRLIFLSAATLAGMYAYNKFVESTSTQKNLLAKEKGEFFDWKEGNVFYTKQGEGEPLLLVHDTDSASSSVEWHKITKKLAKKYTVYTIDLLGCGRSDKPNINYTNYLYVQLLTAFVKEVIKTPTNIVATDISASFVIMTNHMDKEVFKKIVLINPISLKQLEVIPDDLSKFKQVIINTPVIGTFIYNILMNPKQIDRQFRTRYFHKEQGISSTTEDEYYEAAHLDEGNGKYLYSSLLSNYMNFNIGHAIKKIDKPIYIIGSKDVTGNVHTLDDYHKMNKNFEITLLSNCGLYPQLEIPEKMILVIEDQLNK